MAASEPGMDKYSRQRGLVAQDLLADADVTVHGTGPALTYLLQCLAMLGVGARHGRIRLCLDDRAVAEPDLADQFLLRAEDLGQPLAAALAGRIGRLDPAVTVEAGPPLPTGVAVAVPAAHEVERLAGLGGIAVYGQVLPTAVHVGPEAVAGAGPANVLTAALATVCGGLTAQAVINRIGALVSGPAVLSSWVEERLWLSYGGIGRRALDARTPFPVLRGLLQGDPGERFQVLVDGRPVEARVTTVVDDDNVVVSLPARTDEPGRAVVRPVRAHAVPVRALRWSPLANEDVALPDRLAASRLLMCGAGALGSWVGAVLAATPSHGLDLTVVDMDDAVENHNLNRQVLYGVEDIGRPKATRAVQRLAEINPAMRLRPVQTVIAPELEDHLLGEGTRLEIDDPDIAAQRRRIDELREALAAADAVLSCPDNQQTRWVLNRIAERLGVPFINGAVDGFVGRVHVCDPADKGRCLVCWLGTAVAQDPTRRSCTDLVGPAPVPSIVTSAAIIGGIQAATLIAELAGHAAAVARFHALDGAAGTLTGYRAADRDPMECPDHLIKNSEELTHVSQP
ncbi:ThiF family adenylyltransferase [Dactylosporangium sp. CA-139066]|uniref:ThiF family adenylyltransferase n=1 Tax=Dactylosporangium sp. CA-139066 TaxID=3239930 RepID=UPI003D8EFB5D